MPSLITPEVKATSRTKLIALAKANALRQRTADKKEAQALATKIDALHAPFRLAFRKELERRVGGKVVGKECDNAIKRMQVLAKRRPKSEQQRSEIEKELESIRKTLDGIDKEHGVMLSKVTQRTIKRGAYFSAIFKAFEKRGRIEFRELRYGALAMKFTPPWSDLLRPWHPAPQTSFVLKPPYDPEAAVTEQFGALVGFTGTRADASDGLLSADTFAPIAGYQMARAQNGAFLTIPAGFSTIRLRARISNIHSNVTASSSIGASWASCGGIAEVTSLANNSVTRRETSIHYVVAPVIFFAQHIFEGTHTINATFDISDAGDEILVTAGVKADCWAVLAGCAFADAIDHVAKITVELS